MSLSAAEVLRPTFWPERSRASWHVFSRSYSTNGADFVTGTHYHVPDRRDQGLSPEARFDRTPRLVHGALTDILADAHADYQSLAVRAVLGHRARGGANFIDRRHPVSVARYRLGRYGCRYFPPSTCGDVPISNPLPSRVGPAHAIYFATYEAVKHNLGGNTASHTPFVSGFAGACATTASDALMNPFDVVKQRMQVHGSTHASIADCARTVYRTEGFSAFYISYPTTLAMTIPFTAIQFAAYDSLSKVLNPKKKYDPLSHCVAGGLAGAVGAAITTPLDVIKTLLQTRGTSREATIRECKGLREAAKIIYQREGAKGFLRGLQPRVVTTVPSTAICW